MSSSFSISPTSVIVWIGAGQGLLLSVALVRSKKGSIESNRSLAALVLLLSFMVAIGIVLRGKELPTPALYNVGAPFNFLFGPLLYFYFRSLVYGRVDLRKRDLAHFLPFLACILYLIPTFALDPAKKVALFHKGLPGSPLRHHVIGILQCGSVIAYSLYSTVLYSRMKTRLLENYSNVDPRHLEWLQVLLYSYIGFGVLGAFEQALPFAFLPAWFVPLGGASVILGLGYIGHFAPELPKICSEENTDTSTTQPSRSDDPSRLRKSGLKQEFVGRYTRDLVRIMEVEKAFLDGNLSLQRLAKRMNIPAGQLSVLLNDHMHQKFFDLVNYYRIQQAKQILGSSLDKLNMLELGFEVGFNSKSTFYTAFKKLEGCTPLAYLQRLKSARRTLMSPQIPQS